jgi:hypothetical protein
MVAPELVAVEAAVTLLAVFATMAVYETVPLAKLGDRATVALPAVRESALSVASVEGVVEFEPEPEPAETLGWQDMRLSATRAARSEKLLAR